jgi:hypothetical protein
MAVCQVQEIQGAAVKILIQRVCAAWMGLAWFLRNGLLSFVRHETQVKIGEPEASP